MKKIKINCDTVEDYIIVQKILFNKGINWSSNKNKRCQEFEPKYTDKFNQSEYTSLLIENGNFIRCTKRLFCEYEFDAKDFIIKETLKLI